MEEVRNRDHKLRFQRSLGGFVENRFWYYFAPMPKQFLNPENLPNWSDSFSQIVTVQIGTSRAIYISGQVSVDPNNEIIAPGDLVRQTEVALENLSRALTAAKATPADVVRLGIYVKNYEPSKADTISSALGKVFVKERMPASTWIGVASLAREDFLIEIDAIAVVETENASSGET
jgi:enamine deaminase RidA (YjgF/YER057c/UK114 family)